MAREQRGFSLWPGRVGDRLAFCFAIAALPPLALLLAALAATSRQPMHELEWQTLERARSGAAQERAAVLAAGGVLRGLIPAAADPACNATLGRIAAGLPGVAQLAITDGDGVVRCASRTGANGVSVADLPIYRQAMAAPPNAAITIGEAALGPDPAHLLAVAVPLEKAGIAYAVFAPDALAGLAAGLDPNASVEIVDVDNGTILARTPDAKGLAGMLLPEHPAIAAARTGAGSGLVEAADLDGAARLFAFAPVPGFPRLVVAIGIPAATVAASRQPVRLPMAFACLVTALAAAAAGLLASRAILRPLAALRDAAIPLAAGKPADLPRRAPADLQGLAGIIERAGHRLAVRERRIDRLVAELDARDRKLR